MVDVCEEDEGVRLSSVKFSGDGLKLLCGT
jgi:hypothetical protein